MTNQSNSTASAIAQLALSEEQLRVLTAEPIIFNGNNFSEFVKSVESNLKQSDKFDYLSKVIIQNTPVDEKKQSKAIAWRICQWIDPKIRGVFEGADRYAIDVWTELKGIYGESIEIEEHALISKLTRLKITDFETRTKFLHEFLQTMLQVERLDGLKLTSKFKLVLLVNALEDKFKDLVNQAPVLTFEEFLKKLKVLILKPNQPAPIGQSTFVTQTNPNKKPFNNQFNNQQNGQYHGQHQYTGNHRNFNQNRNQNNYNNQNNRVQFNNQQFQPNRQQNYRQNNNFNQRKNWNNTQSNYNSRGNWNGNRSNGANRNGRSYFSGNADDQTDQNFPDSKQQQQQMQPNPLNDQCDYQPDEGPGYMFCSRVLASDCLPRDIVIYDSATSKPIINNKDLFVDLRPLTEAERRTDGVKTGCGNVLKATAIGTIRLKTTAGITIDVQNAKYIPEFEANVIPQPKSQSFNIYADNNDLLFVDKSTKKTTKIGHCRVGIDDLYQFDLVKPSHPPILFRQNRSD